MPGKHAQFAQKPGKTVPFGATLLDEVRTLVQSESVSLSESGSSCSVSEESRSPLQFVFEFTPEHYPLVVITLADNPATSNLLRKDYAETSR